MVMSLIESLTRIKNAVYGREVREAIHDGVFRANQIADGAVSTTDQTQIRQDNLEAYNDQMIQEMTDKDVISAPEIIQARGGMATLSERFDDTSAKLAHIADDNAISPDDYEGDDFEKVQQALDALSDNKSSVRFSRMYDITGKGTLLLKLNQLDRRSIYLIGVGGGIRKDDVGDVFSTPGPQTGDVVTSNMRFNSVSGAGTRIFDGDKIIRLTDFGSSFRNVDTIIGAATYIQSIYLNSSSIVGGEGYAISFATAYDVNFNTILVEHRDSFMNQFHASDGNTIFKLTIRDSLIEGLEGKAISIEGTVSLMTIDGLYVEANKGGDIYFESTSYINILYINNLMSAMPDRHEVMPAIKFSGRHENVSIENTMFMGQQNNGLDVTDLTTGWNYIKLNNVRHLSKNIPYIPTNTNKVMIESTLPVYHKLSNPNDYDFRKFHLGVFDKIYGSVALYWIGSGYHERIYDIGHSIKVDDMISVQVSYNNTNKDITLAHVGRTSDGKLLVRINNNSEDANVHLQLGITILTSIIGRPSSGIEV